MMSRVKRSQQAFLILLLLGILFSLAVMRQDTLQYKKTRELDGKAAQGETEDSSDKPNLPKRKPRIAITFDDGPKGRFTVALLDGLKERGVKATFFLIGNCAKESPEIVKRMQNEGHLIGNHTYNHVDIARLSDEEAIKEIETTSRLIKEITGNTTDFVRPPFGAWQEDLEQELDVMPVSWSVDPLDWTTTNVDEIVNRVVTKTEEDDIILLHDCYDSSVKAALRIIDILQKKGFEFVTVDELLLN